MIRFLANKFRAGLMGPGHVKKLDTALSYAPQSLSGPQQEQARENLGATWHYLGLGVKVE